MLIFDAHLDLAMNAVEWNRDLTQTLEHVRRREAGRTDRKDRSRGVVTLDEMRRGRVGLCIATQIARYVGPGNPLPGWHSPEIAWAITQAQLAWYRAMEEEGQMVQVADRATLERMVELWQRPVDTAPIGYVLSLEGADSLITPAHLERSYAQGLRAVGPAHYGAGRYAPGTGADGGLTLLGRELLKEMRHLGVVLDVTHLTDRGFWEALELFDGPVWASHSNCRSLVPDGRQFDDRQIRALIERDAVIGAAFDAWMLYPGWKKGITTPQEANVTIETVVDHIDHVCQLAGNARHAGIGSDLDGGYGREQCPRDLNSIADLARLKDLLQRRGYSQEDIRMILHGNWIRKLREVLP
ncbi:MAG: peptidase [Pirellulaceae bacterium]|nr:MAG: peptidase [Pirellulaceae bacterium]